MTADSPTLIPRGRAHIPSLDGLRGLAMLAVVCCHLIWPGATLHWLDRVLVNGWIGVDLFFVLSGFLITGILIDARGTPNYFRTFYARRALRIFPIYYLFLVVLLIWIPFGAWLTAHAPGGQYPHVTANSAWYWTYTVNVLQARNANVDWFYTGHLWSLSVEEQFYLVWPAIVLLVPVRKLPATCLVVAVTALLLRAWWVATDHRMLGAYVLTPLRMDALAVGALVASLARTVEGTALLRRWYRRVGLVALAAALPVQIAFGADLQHRWVVLIGYAANATVFAALIVWLLDDARPRRSLEHRWLRRIGQISYGGYLYHLPLIGLFASQRKHLMSFAGSDPILIAIAHVVWIGGILATTLAVASASYRWLETPFLELKDRRFATGGTTVPPTILSTGGIAREVAAPPAARRRHSIR